MANLSIIIPIYNEEENIPQLLEKTRAACEALQKTYEIILVDDGSRDDSFRLLQEQALNNKHLRVIRFRKNFGQTAAIMAGLDIAQGEIIIFMDGDLQNDPQDIQILIDKLNEGYDVVSGWRKRRKDPFFTRVLPSKMANGIISFFTGVRLRDYGCTLKAYRYDVLKDVRLYGEMHRFLPFYAALAGAKICEVPVQHHPRVHGKSKYGLSRTFKVLLDLLTISFLGGYSQKPIYFFGGAGVIALASGVLLAFYTLYQKLAFGIYVHRNPLVLLGGILFLGGLQFLLMGVLAEMLMRTYHESQSKPTYLVKEMVGVGKS